MDAEFFCKGDCVGAEDAEGSSERISIEAAIGDDGCHDAVCDAESGAWINDVGVAFAVDFHELFGITRSADGAIAEQTGGGFAGDLDVPPGRIWRGIGNGDIAAGLDNCLIDIVSF